MLSAADKYSWFELSAVDLELFQKLKNQVHHLILAVSSVGRTFMEPSNENERTALIWIPGLWRMAGQWIPANRKFRSSVNFKEGKILLVDERVNTLAEFNPSEKNHNELFIWMEQHIISLELSSAHLKWDLPFKTPDYPTFKGARFQYFADEFWEGFGGYFHNAFFYFTHYKEQHKNVGDIVIQSEQLTITMDHTFRKTDEKETDTFFTLGFSPGDSIFGEPYFFLTSQPFIAETKLRKLKTQGFWYTDEWVGAVYFAKNLWSSNEQMATLSYFFEDAIKKVKSPLLD